MNHNPREKTALTLETWLSSFRGWSAGKIDHIKEFWSSVPSPLLVGKKVFMFWIRRVSSVTTVKWVGQLPQVENNGHIWGQTEAPLPRPLTALVWRERLWVLRWIPTQLRAGLFRELQTRLARAPATFWKWDGSTALFFSCGRPRALFAVVTILGRVISLSMWHLKTWMLHME